jgi:hypothetical protein
VIKSANLKTTLGLGATMRALKVIFGFLIVVVAAFLVVIFFGTEESIYRCTQTQGPMSQAGAPPLLVMKLELYRWFIPGNSQGMLHYEIPSTHQLGIFAKVGRMGDHVYFYDDDGSLQGHFSTINSSISLYLSKDNLFEGTCKT